MVTPKPETLNLKPLRLGGRSVADRVASERGGKLGDTVAYKIRFEDSQKPQARNKRLP